MRRPAQAKAMEGMESLAQPRPSTHYGKHDALMNMLHEERDPTPLEQHLLNELKAELTVPKHRADHAQAHAPAQTAAQAEKPTAQRVQREPSLRVLNAELAALDKAKYAISTKLFEEDRAPTPQEQHVLDSRTALIKTRNQARDRQLADMLRALGPLETISAPKTTTSRLAIVQQDVMQFNANKLRAAQAQGLQPEKFARHYARAERRLQSLRDSGAHYPDVQRLERMMQGYHNLMNLEKIVRHTDDQLERLGGPRLMDSMPTTPEERTQMRENDYAEQEEAMRNGY
ncbi:putative type III effector protein [Xanthomonas translucens pv. arrhenatheri LMG 727]|uniref:Putative type III effector protein n=2 Tax=Xanthomonas translucens group TaxID=3390202 RepID=A0A0K2ZRI6_9XANT|nr:putative type III effector protein [Xanthomonas translucens pv. arrhenatheri LMG 727]